MKRKSSIKEILIQILNRLDNIHSIPREWLTVDQLSEYTGMAKNTIYQYVHETRIPFHKIPNSRKLIFKRREIDSWIMGEKKESDIDPKKIADEIWESVK